MNAYKRGQIELVLAIGSVVVAIALVIYCCIAYRDEISRYILPMIILLVFSSIPIAVLFMHAFKNLKKGKP